MFFVGDVNNDGKITLEDMLKIFQSLNGGTLTEEEKKRADINGDGTVNALDYVLMQRHFQGIQIIYETRE